MVWKCTLTMWWMTGKQSEVWTLPPAVAPASVVCLKLKKKMNWKGLLFFHKHIHKLFATCRPIIMKCIKSSAYFLGLNGERLNISPETASQQSMASLFLHFIFRQTLTSEPSSECAVYQKGSLTISLYKGQRKHSGWLQYAEECLFSYKIDEDVLSVGMGCVGGDERSFGKKKINFCITDIVLFTMITMKCLGINP